MNSTPIVPLRTEMNMGAPMSGIRSLGGTQDMALMMTNCERTLGTLNARGLVLPLGLLHIRRSVSARERQGRRRENGG